MKIAILSDIHGNIDAFKQIVDIASNEGVAKFFFLGDFVGYYYHPKQVLELLSKLDAVVIQGNHERILKGLIDGTIPAEEVSRKYGSGHRYALEQLSTEQIDFLVGLPASLRIGIDGCTFQLCHGSPFDPDKYIYPDTSVDILKQCDVEQVDFVLIGHSHYQFIYRNANSLLINLGSVGQSRSRGGVAQWGIINTKSMCVELRTTFYDAGKLIQQCSSIDPDMPYLKEVLTRK